ncbi:hypothetical protein GEMRC1_010868 [Eukaryota sp. GEM-RC1]
MDVLHTYLKDQLLSHICSLDDSTASAKESQISLITQIDNLSKALQKLDVSDLPSLRHSAQKLKIVKQRVSRMSASIDTIHNRLTKVHTVASAKLASVKSFDIPHKSVTNADEISSSSTQKEDKPDHNQNSTVEAVQESLPPTSHVNEEVEEEDQSSKSPTSEPSKEEDLDQISTTEVVEESLPPISHVHDEVEEEDVPSKGITSETESHD